MAGMGVDSHAGRLSYNLDLSTVLITSIYLFIYLLLNQKSLIEV